MLKTIHIAGLVSLVGSGVVLLTLYPSITHGEFQESHDDSYSDAVPSITQGWLPLGLPVSATLIHEWHDLDTNLRLGSFRFQPDALRLTAVTLHPELPSEIRIDPDPSFAAPVPFGPTRAEIQELGFEFFRSQQDLWFAIHWTAGLAYYWNVVKAVAKVRWRCGGLASKQESRSRFYVGTGSAECKAAPIPRQLTGTPFGKAPQRIDAQLRLRFRPSTSRARVPASSRAPRECQP